MNNINIKQTSLEAIFELSDKIPFVILPGYSLKSIRSEFYLTTYLDGQFFIAGDFKNIEGYRSLRLRLGDWIILELEDGVIKLSNQQGLNSKTNARLGYEYNPGKGVNKLTAKRTKLYQGQNIIIKGGYDVGKTRCANKIADGFEENGFKTYRVSIGQWKEDSLGKNSIVIDSPNIEYQMEQFYLVLYKVLRDANVGEDCCLVIDSIDEFISRQSKKLTNGLNTMLLFVNKLFHLSGSFTTGSITIICTNGDYIKSISEQLKSFSEAQIFLANFETNGEADYSRKPNFT